MYFEFSIPKINFSAGTQEIAYHTNKRDCMVRSVSFKVPSGENGQLDFISKLSSNTDAQKLPGFLKQYVPIDMPHRLKHLVERPRKRGPDPA